MLRLAESILLGLKLNPSIDRVSISTCAIGGSLRANGIEVLTDYLPPSIQNSDADYAHFYGLYPWLGNRRYVECPRCREYDGFGLSGPSVVFHVFDEHVIGDKRMTVEQMCDWLDSIDPTPRTTEGTEVANGAKEDCVDVASSSHTVAA